MEWKLHIVISQQMEFKTKAEALRYACALTADQQADRIEGPDNFLMPREEIQKWRLANRES
jgi:hypothetical protein